MAFRPRIAILGGGVGSLVTAYYLTRTPELRAKHDVTLYQMGWRLGGKGASGRSLVPDEHLRIEEHGLHLWFGFYENAFRTIQEVYARKPARADDRLVTWRDGFRPCSFTPIADQDGAPPPGELIEIGIDLAQQILHRAFNVVNLKQLPDTTNASNASYQELCVAPMTLTAIRGAGRLKGDFEIEIPKYASHDVAGDLGIAGAGPVYPVQFGMYINMDFSVPVGTRIWSAP